MRLNVFVQSPRCRDVKRVEVTYEKLVKVHLGIKLSTGKPEVRSCNTTVCCEVTGFNKVAEQMLLCQHLENTSREVLIN